MILIVTWFPFCFTGFLIEPDQNWVLESGRRYIVTIQIFDSDNHLIYASPNIRIKVIVDWNKGFGLENCIVYGCTLHSAINDEKYESPVVQELQD